MVPAIFVVIVAIALLYVYGPKSGSSCVDVGCCCESGCCCVTDCNITNDPNTWPSGDRIWLVCHAIAMAEGANVAGSNPDRLNNPGDISDGFVRFGGEEHSGSSVTNFPNKQTGWKWLHDKIQHIANGHSHEYSPTESWNSFAQKWAGDWKNWVTNLTGILGVAPTSSLSDYLNS